MARTYNDLFDKIADFGALYRAWHRVIRGRRGQMDVLHFARDLEPNLIALQESLLAGSYATGPYRHFKVFEPKERAIAALPLRDRIVQHALIETIEPIWEARFIHDSYACRPGKGTHAGADRAQRMLRTVQRTSGAAYVLKADIAGYFPSISHDVLKRLLRRRIACRPTVRLIDDIIDSAADEKSPLPRGIPIGSLTSQFFANVYLHDLDSFVKNDLSVKRYLRYMDDFVVVDESKERLHELRREIDDFLYARLALRFNRKTQVFPVRLGGRALDFLGYRIWPTHRLLRRDSVGRMRKKMKRMAGQYHAGQIDLDRVDRVVASWVGHARHAQTYTLRRRLISGQSFIPPPRRAVK